MNCVYYLDIKNNPQGLLKLGSSGSLSSCAGRASDFSCEYFWLGPVPPNPLDSCEMCYHIFLVLRAGHETVVIESCSDLKVALI